MTQTTVQGLRKVGEGREAELFEWEGGTRLPAGRQVLRLLRDSDDVAKLEREAAAMRSALAAGVRAPEPFEVVTVDGRAGMVMERIEGPDLLTEIGRRPWILFNAARVSSRFHAQLHGVRGPPDVPDLRSKVRRGIEQGGALPAEAAERALSLLETLPDGEALCHGDFHPANLLMAPDGPVLIDWANVSRGVPTADVARTVMIVRLGEPPPGTSPVVRLLALVGRRVLLSTYLRTYRRERALDEAALRRWEYVRWAERLAAEPIPEEEPKLLRLLAQSPEG
ncbi:MAG: aminoglycoside phosphotransferase family protein [Dehalococcoidia bacterium]